jgi:hypothetical protein
MVVNEIHRHVLRGERERERFQMDLLPPSSETVKEATCSFEMLFRLPLTRRHNTEHFIPSVY